jgi:dihydroxyacetone kinase-like predicted kinase
MAKATGPLYSQSAHGSLGKAINFSNWKNLQRVKIHQKPRNPKTNTQSINRNYCTEAVIAWQTLTTEEKLIWDRW